MRLFPKAVSIFMAVAVFSAGAAGQEENPELAQARAQFDKDVEFSTRPIRDRYTARLESLKRTLGARGDARGAAAVQDEIDRLKALIPEPGTARLAGKWIITYVNGFTRRYSISQEGIVTLSEMDGKQLTPPPKAKLIAKGADFLLEIEEGKIERLKLTGKTLSVEHFNPKSLFESGTPNNRGTGILASSRKE